MNLMSESDLEKRIHSFISSKIDYGNAIKQLQTIQNAAARVLTRTKRNEHITPTPRSLHWLPVIYRID